MSLHLEHEYLMSLHLEHEYLMSLVLGINRPTNRPSCFRTVVYVIEYFPPKQPHVAWYWKTNQANTWQSFPMSSRFDCLKVKVVKMMFLVIKGVEVPINRSFSLYIDNLIVTEGFFSDKRQLHIWGMAYWLALINQGIVRQTRYFSLNIFYSKEKDLVWH